MRDEKKKKTRKRCASVEEEEFVVTLKLWRLSITVTHCNQTLCVPISNAQEGRKK